MEGDIEPASPWESRSKAVTRSRCRRPPQVIPRQLQKRRDSLFHEAKFPKGSDSRDLKDRRACRSVWFCKVVVVQDAGWKENEMEEKKRKMRTNGPNEFKLRACERDILGFWEESTIQGSSCCHSTA